MMQIDPVKERLLASDETFRQLFEEHQEFKQRLGVLRQKSLLSQEDEIEMKRIKLHKLTLKDRMEAIVRQHEEELASVTA
jgi:uncharacterized protein YdcH (DUF465 family)